MDVPTDHYTDPDWRQIAWVLCPGTRPDSEDVDTVATDHSRSYLLDHLEHYMGKRVQAGAGPRRHLRMSA